MAKQAETPGSGGVPFAKFLSPGDTLVAAFGGGDRRQMRKFGSTELLTKDDGKTARMEEVLYLVAMPGTTAVTGDVDKGDTAVITESTIVRFAVSGFRWGQVIDQRKSLPEHSGFKAGTSCSGDIYTITMTGWSAATENPQAAINAGLQVVEKRIVMPTDAEHEKWALAQLRNGKPANAAKDYSITIRRPSAAEKRWEQEGDALFDAKPWTKQPEMAGGGGSTPDEEPF